MSIPPDELAACIRLLEALADDPAALAGLDDQTRRTLLMAAGRLSRPEREAKRKLHKALRRRDRDLARAHDARLVASTLNRMARRSSSFVLPGSTVSAEATAEPPAGELKQPRDCYVCKQPFRHLHHFYDSLCPACAELNFHKRQQRAALDGRVALVTGARIKIGFQAALLLLRSGARVIVTTRFPRDAAERFAREPDFAAWQERLAIYGLDLRQVPSVERFCAHLDASEPRLDFVINNAAQTVRRPPQFYRTLAEREARPAGELPAATQKLLAGGRALAAAQPSLPSPAQAALMPLSADDLAHATELFPPGVLDLDEQQVDLRRHNSWRLTAAEVSTVELLEVHLVNAVSPFLLTARLKPLLARTGTGDQHVVNVSAMEAQFARNKKTDKHPHTNMAKAALNMLTRTSAVDYVRSGIHMNSVDTGWITDEDPLHHVARKQDEHDFHPPLDAIDGAARVLDPIFDGINTGRHMWGLFLKDYKPIPW